MLIYFTSQKDDCARRLNQTFEIRTLTGHNQDNVEQELGFVFKCKSDNEVVQYIFQQLISGESL